MKGRRGMAAKKSGGGMILLTAWGGISLREG